MDGTESTAAEQTSQPLRRIPLFKELSAPDLAELEAAMEPRRCPDQQTIVSLHEKGEDFYVIRTGQVEVSCPDESGRDVVLGTLSAGQFFGEISLLDGGPRTATVRARGEVGLLRLEREQFIGFLRTHPDAAVHMLTVLGRRQREMTERVRGIRNVNEAVDRQRTRWQAVAERIAAVTVTKWFLGANLAFLTGWIVINRLLPPGRRYDAEHFDLLSLMVTIEALFITLFVLISQNQQSERDRIRADLDYQVNLRAHQELVQLQRKMEHLESAFELMNSGSASAPPPPPPRELDAASLPGRTPANVPACATGAPAESAGEDEDGEMLA